MCVCVGGDYGVGGQHQSKATTTRRQQQPKATRPRRPSPRPHRPPALRRPATPQFNSTSVWSNTSATLNRTLLRPSWHDWEECIQGRVVYITCRIFLRSSPWYAPNETHPAALTGNSTPFLAAPDMPVNATRHTLGQIAGCTQGASDVNTTSGLPMRVTCTYFRAPWGARTSTLITARTNTRLLWDDADTGARQSFVNIPYGQTYTPGANWTYGDTGTTAAVIRLTVASMSPFMFVRNGWSGRYLVMYELVGGWGVEWGGRGG